MVLLYLDIGSFCSCLGQRMHKLLLELHDCLHLQAALLYSRPSRMRCRQAKGLLYVMIRGVMQQSQHAENTQCLFTRIVALAPALKSHMCMHSAIRHIAHAGHSFRHYRFSHAERTLCSNISLAEPALLSGWVDGSAILAAVATCTHTEH